MYARLFEGLCRVCLRHWTPEKLLTPLVLGDNLTDHAAAVLAFADVEISPTDGYPQKICPKCLTLLKQAILFKLTCENTHRQLEEMRNKARGSLKTVIVKYCLHRHFSPENPFVYEEKYKRETKTNGLKYSDGSPLVPAYEEQKEMCHYDGEFHDVPLISDVDNGFDEKFNSGTNDLEQTRITQQAKLSPESIVSKLDNGKKEKLKQRPVCHICNKTYSSTGGLRAHLKRHEEDKFICEVCGRGFKAKNELEVHCLCAHSFPRSYGCAHCDYKAKFKRDLVAHLNKHTGERPYKCWQCEKSFFSRQVYRQHQVYHRSKNFKCERCPRTFHSRYKLKAHGEKVHDKKHLYRCSVTDCPTGFRKGASVRKHLTDAHGIPRAAQGKIQRVPVALVQFMVDCVRLRPNSVQFKKEHLG